MQKITVGKTAKLTIKVNETNLASTVKSGSLPVFATPIMIALMEETAVKCLADCLDQGQSSVGTAVNIEHTAPSVLGAEITASATITAIDRRKVDFSVTASDNFGEIGRGTHTRFIVDSEKFMKKAQSRNGKTENDNT